MYMNEELIQEKLEEMNATKIQKLDSQMYLVNFDLKEDMRISYVFNITREGKYFLQRMRPYSMVHGKFSNEYEVLSFIKHDVEKFQNAANSTNFIKFLEISNKGLQGERMIKRNIISSPRHLWSLTFYTFYIKL